MSKSSITGLLMPDLILGIDGGGSKTLALLADVHGRVLGRGLGGNANYQSAGFAAASRALREAIAHAAAGRGAERRGRAARRVSQGRRPQGGRAVPRPGRGRAR